MADDFTCEACDSRTGEPLCSRKATHWHPAAGDEERMAICERHACGHCVPMQPAPGEERGK